jgi:hypothetical protein
MGGAMGGANFVLLRISIVLTLELFGNFKFPNNFRLKTQNSYQFARLGRQPTGLANKSILIHVCFFHYRIVKYQTTFHVLILTYQFLCLQPQKLSVQFFPRKKPGDLIMADRPAR